MKRWRRPLILITFLLLAGAVVNVAVAWTASGTRLLMSRSLYFWPVESRGWHDQVPGWPAFDWERGGMSLYRHGLAWRWVRQESWEEDRERGVVAYQLDRLWAGWPAYSLSRTTPMELTPAVRFGVNQPRTPGAPLWANGVAWRLPMRPLPLGFAINTFFYAAILALPLSFFPIRRRLRARRGRCPKCGYDLAGLAVADPAAPCPECGGTQ